MTAARLRLYVALCVAVAVAVSAVVVTVAAPGGRPAPAPWTLAVLWVLAVVAGTVKVGLPVRGLGGVRETTSLLEIAAIALMVFLEPALAVALAVTATLVSEVVCHRAEVSKMAFNTASEAIAIAIGGTVYHAIAGPGFTGSAVPIAAALTAAALYIAVTLATMVGLVAVLHGGAWRAARSTEFRSSLLVSGGIATTGVIAAVLAAEAPLALPLMMVLALLDHVHAQGRQEHLELTASKDAADAASQAKSEFLSWMSHEMRTPLNAILGFGQLLTTHDGLDETAKDHVGYMMSSGRHLVTIIDEILDFSQIEAGHLTLAVTVTDVRALAEESLAFIRPLADERGIGTELVSPAGDELYAHADPHRLRQVLLNLLSNAVKYNGAAGQVVVTLDTTDGDVRIAVRDTGDGITPADLARLFVPFERLGRSTSSIQGTGLGLSVSRCYVEAMGGRLEVASEVGSGSTFSVLLPSSF